MNKVILTGRWSQDIELKYLNDGTAIATSSIAVDDGYGDKKKTHFFRVTMWKKTAEHTAEYSGKGKKVAIEGRLQQRSWDKDGKTQYSVEVTAENVEFLEPKQKDEEQSYSQRQEQRENKNRDPFADDGKPIDISDDDLPF